MTDRQLRNLSPKHLLMIIRDQEKELQSLKAENDRLLLIYQSIQNHFTNQTHNRQNSSFQESEYTLHSADTGSNINYQKAAVPAEPYDTFAEQQQNPQSQTYQPPLREIYLKPQAENGRFSKELQEQIKEYSRNYNVS